MYDFIMQFVLWFMCGILTIQSVSPKMKCDYFFIIFKGHQIWDAEGNFTSCKSPVLSSGSI